MPDLSFLRDALMIMASLFAGIAFLLLIWLYLRVTKARRPEPAPFQQLTEMAILFQTMRGVVREQKTLARDFNRSVDKRVALIRQVLKEVMSEHERLRQSQRELGAMIERARDDVAAAQRRPASAPAEPAPRAPQAAYSAAAAAPEAASAERPPVAANAPLRAIAQPEEAPSSSDLIDNWVGLDFVARDPEAEAAQVAEAAPESPRDPELARQAFRELLKMDAGGAGPSASPAVDDPRAGNGRQKADSLKQRVYDYSDAGMSVGEIARELGVGKGEIRLILSLREKDPKAE